MKPLKIPNDLTYVGVFLTFKCRYKCSYCINRHGKLKPRKELTPEQWIEGLNRLRIPRELMVPITLQGGEPSAYRGWLNVIQGLNDNLYVDLLTNMDFDVKRFMEKVSPDRLQRNVPYASIRGSYHPEFSDKDELFEKTLMLQEEDYSIGLFAVDHPDGNIRKVQAEAKALGIDFRLKEFLGWHKGALWGEYRHPLDFKAKESKIVQCKTTELLIAPDGFIHKCHADLYAGRCSVGHILEEDYNIEFMFRECDHRHIKGQLCNCNPCDLKIKNDRFQRYGSCAVEIRE